MIVGDWEPCNTGGARFPGPHEKLGRVRAKVTSAVPLDEAAARLLAEKIAGATKAQVVVERAVDPALIGGVVAQVGSLVYDGSVRTQLEQLRRTLKQ
jgi:F-type H+-transporting ATPase subunit delta